MNDRNKLTMLSKDLDQHRAMRGFLALIGVGFIGRVIFIWNLGKVGLVDETEPLFAEAARQMLVRQDWVTPYFNEATRFDKPPLVYWLMAIAYQLVEVNAWGVRLPSALAALGLMGMLFYFLLRYRCQTLRSWVTWLTAALGAGIYATNLLTIVWGRTGVADMVLTGCMAMALLCFFCGYAALPPERPPLHDPWQGDSGGNTGGDSGGNSGANLPAHSRQVQAQQSVGAMPLGLQAFFNPSTGFYGLFYCFIGLAVLTKGPVGMVLPGLIVGAFLWYTGQFRQVWQEMRPWLGLGLILLLTLPWYVLVTVVHGSAFIDSFFVYHNLERFTRVVNHHSGPWYFYFLVLAAGFAPWSAFLPNAIAHTRFWERAYWRRQPRTQHLGIFALCWLAGVFLFFTIAVTKLPSYVLPLIPAAALLVARQWQDWLSRSRRGWGLKLSGLISSLCFIGVAIAIWLVPGWVEDDSLQPDLARLMQTSGIILRASAIAAAVALGYLGLVLSRRTSWLWVPNLLGFVALFALVLLPALAIVDSQRQLPLRQLAAAAAQQQRPAEPLVMIGTPRPSVVFYSRQPFKFLDRVEQLPAYAAQQPEPPPSLLVLGSQKALSPKRLTQPNLAVAGPYRLIRLKRQEWEQFSQTVSGFQRQNRDELKPRPSHRDHRYESTGNPSPASRNDADPNARTMHESFIDNLCSQSGIGHDSAASIHLCRSNPSPVLL